MYRKILALFLLFACFSLPGKSQRIEELKIKADSLFEQRAYTSALEAYLLLYESKESTEAESAKYANQIAKCYQAEKNLRDAEEWLKKAIAHYGSLKLTDEYHLTLSLLAAIKDEEGKYEEAIESISKSAAYFQSRSDSLQAAKSLHNLALYSYHAGEIDKAIAKYIEAISWSGDDNKMSKAISYNQLGNIWADDMGDEEKALEYYRQSLFFKIQAGANPRSISFSYNNIGISHKNLGRFDSGMIYYKKALEMAIESNEKSAQLNPLINIANLQKRMGNSLEATKTYQQALEVASSASMRQQVNLHTNLAILYNEQGAYAKALEHIRLASDLNTSTQSMVDIRDVLAQEALAFAGLKQFDLAFEAQQKYTQLNDSIRQREREQDLTQMMVQYEAAQKDKALLEQKQLLQEKELALKNRSIWFISLLGMALLIIGISYVLYKRKEALARQAAMELSLAEEKEKAHMQEERLRISRELHDNIGSYLTLIYASVESLPESSPEKIHHSLPELQNTLSLSMRELRKTVWLLNNQEISIDQLIIRLQDFFKPWQQSGLKIQITSKGDGQRNLTDVQTTHVFRIIQEAVNNACKHGQSKSITIQISAEASEGIHFSIQDDGQGFEASAMNSGNGLKNMELRMQELGGQLQIQSLPEKGTKVEGRF